MLFLLPDDFIPGLLPCVDTTAEGRDIPITHPHVFRCLTGRRVFIGSGAIKDDGLVHFYLCQSGFKFLQGDSPFQHNHAARFFIRISTNQEGFSRGNLGVSVLRRDSSHLNLCTCLACLLCRRLRGCYEKQPYKQCRRTHDLSVSYYPNHLKASLLACQIIYPTKY